MLERTHTENTSNTRTVTPSDDPLLRTREAAQFIDMSAAFLAKARRHGRGPGFVRVGGRAVRYKRSTLIAYLDSQEVAG